MRIFLPPYSGWFSLAGGSCLGAKRDMER